MGLVILLTGAFLGYTMNYYHVTEEGKQFIKSTHEVVVTSGEDYLFFDGDGDESALVFYPGAKVEYTAYGRLMMELAKSGTDCFLVKMPFNMAFLGMNKAEEIREQYDYKKWYVGGHSLGGAMAANYASKNLENIDGVLLLGAYTVNDLQKTEAGKTNTLSGYETDDTRELQNQDIHVLVAYGSNDQVVKMENIVAGRKLVPDNYEEVCIEGGNHAMFGDYGPQKGDGEAEITASEQVKKVVDSWVKITQES